MPGRRQNSALPVLLPKAGHSIIAWKNGGGMTREVVRHPAGSSLDDFAWRISVAAVSMDGPFSAFPGIDRSLALINGSGLVLQRDGQLVTLTSRTPAFEFAGEEKVEGFLTAGTVTDFNVMSRRQWFTHRLERRTVSGSLCIPHFGHAVLVYVVRGTSCILFPQLTAAPLMPGDAVLLTAPGQRLTLHATQAEILLAHIFSNS